MAVERKKILVVDDSITSITMNQMVLDRGPYDVVTAHDGAEGLERALADPPDLILLDITMPVMDGFEMLTQIRAMEATSTIPVIMVTTHGEMENMELGYTKGCNDYVTKPVDAEELLAKVDNWLGA